MKKKIAVLVTAAMMTVSLVACGKKDDDKKTEAATQAATQAATEAVTEGDAGNETEAPTDETTEATAQTGDVRSKAKVVINGTEVSPGDSFTDVSGSLGAEVKPSSSAKPCDPNARGELVSHYYAGVTVEENIDHVISAIYIPGENDPSDSVKLAAGVGYGTSKDEAISAFGIAGTAEELEYGGSAQDGDFYVSFVWDDNGNVMSISVSDMSVRP